MLPTFNEYGMLPAGDYELTLDELRSSLLVVGPSPSPPNWDKEWRLSLVDNLEVMVRQLWAVGVTEIFVDGSFAEDKDHPNDIDGYFECDMDALISGTLERELNRIDHYKVWTWDPKARQPDRGSFKAQLPMWHRYRVELYPHFGQLCGIQDKYGNDLEFPSAFRMSRRDGRPRGIIKIGETP
ncbi:DUF6932 family protein [Bradymonas sediminis]|uniref:Uncharacterized protein n=1 Tax=Bradymonas sediminis TaxID=1548548 RepID=A0A2Z4FQ02_9DELT|nr:hypothetical protein [Bradymonas sediminis]AWV90845.1 hypothetical protein DN745_16570 [Bradymonas sediminis]TDP75418.1 hypothetical protein DFR33_104285 [Bradymonas sediminis]